MAQVIPPVPPGTPIGSGQWADWYEKIRRVINDANGAAVDLTTNVTGTLAITHGGTGRTTPGASATVTLAKLTTGGTTGTLTFVNGILTAVVAAT